ncbi:hypothetical protein Y032_0154g2990 [Ancylostoma ceylanicum]|uniref:Uncharacterized protein n=1 Tax=Ancylostoma ceylanicum TaxID=53326 RepID=A0A016SZ52_9BILA|nr:hypothetical protein Y032_0154g2990 [Ancylostoma ceylanicum]
MGGCCLRDDRTRQDLVTVYSSVFCLKNWLEERTPGSLFLSKLKGETSSVSTFRQNISSAQNDFLISTGSSVADCEPYLE